LDHPVYHIPAPYIRIWNASNGDILSSEEIHDFFSGKDPLNSSKAPKNPIDDSRNTTDYRQYTQGMLYPDMHPYRQNECFSALHLCELEKQFRFLSTAPTLGGEKKPYLTWFSLFGKFLGITISPENYKQLQESDFVG
jgi:hypothetical protein